MCILSIPFYYVPYIYKEPFDGINGQFWCQTLTVPQTDNLKHVLRQFKLDQLVVGLFQLISIYIRNATQQEHATR